jgi:hypothetical protein
MPNVFGRDAYGVEEIVGAFRRHGDAVRGTYRARYVFEPGSRDPYGGVALERPPSMRGNPPEVVFPWEQIFVSAAACAGSDYPMLARHLGIPLERAELVVEGVFDPRGAFDGLAGFRAPPEAAPCFLSLRLRAVLVSPAPREALERLHARALGRNMVLGALRGIPMASELEVREPGASARPGAEAGAAQPG